MNPRLVDRIALGVATISLLVIGIRPASVRPVDSGVVVLRTPGASMADARSVAESLGGAKVIDLEAGERPGTEGRLHLVGWGLDAGELRRWSDRELVLHARPLPPGVRQVSWPGSVALGEEIQVVVGAAGGLNRWAVLEGEDGPADSLAMKGERVTPTALRHRPRAVGTFRYVLRTPTSSDTFSVLVTEPMLPPVLILASAPSREWSDLRDWIVRQGGRVTLRTAVARGRTRVERINEAIRPEDPLARRALAATGIVVTDTRTLASLSRVDHQALQAAVADGLGLVVVLGDEDHRAIEQLVPWRLTAVADLTERQVRPRVEGRTISPTPVPAGGSVMASGPFGSGTLLDDGQGGVLAMSTTLGRGRMVGTVVNGAGRWLRGGEDGAFALYWHTLVDAAAREDQHEPRWELPSGPVIIDRETSISRRGAGGDHWVIAGDTLLGSADPLMPARRTARWWPTSTGWNELDNARLFVTGPASWRAWQAAERTRETVHAIARRRGEAVPGESVPVRVPWPLLPSYILFVGAAAVLWRGVQGRGPSTRSELAGKR